MSDIQKLRFYTDESGTPYEDGENPFPRTKEDDDFDQMMIEKYNQERKEMHEKTKTMVEAAIPELRKFSMNVYKLKSSDWRTPQEIAELEGFELDKLP